MLVLCRYLHSGDWPAAAAFSVLAVLAFAVYTLGLGQMDQIAAKHVEGLTAALSKI
jgi:hypothetical protein